MEIFHPQDPLHSFVTGCGHRSVFFSMLIQASLNEIQDKLAGKIELIMNTLDRNIKNFLTQALQLDHRTLILESTDHAEL